MHFTYLKFNLLHLPPSSPILQSHQLTKGLLYAVSYTAALYWSTTFWLHSDRKSTVAADELFAPFQRQILPCLNNIKFLNRAI